MFFFFVFFFLLLLLLLLFSESETRQCLGQSQMTFDNLLGYILSKSKCMQSFITIVHSVWPFSLFQNLTTASTDVKYHFAIFWARFGNPSVLIMSIVIGMQNFIKIYQKIQEIGPVSFFFFFFFFQNLNLCKTSTNPKCHLTILLATSCQYTNVYAKFHHNVPLSSRHRAIFTFFQIGAMQNLDR